MSRTKKIAVLAIIAMVLTLMPGALFAATADDNRLAGSTRIETALEIASAGWATAGAVVLAPANDANLVDALAAAPLAGQENAPILLTYVDSLNADVKARIAALGATKVYVIGAISDAVAAEVDAIDNVTVEVLKGANRIATAAAVNAKLAAPAGTFVVGFDAIPDALSVASYAAKNKLAIVLANYDGSVDSAALVGAATYIVGGPTLVKDITGATRMYGADRFATNADVASKLSFSYDKVYVANGVSLVDALAVAPLAAKADAFVALASATDVAAKSVVNGKIGASTQVIAVGGTGAVSDAVRDKIGFESSEPVVCAVDVKSYDDDTKNQYVTFTVNGKSSTVEALNAMGWDLEFTAGISKSDVTSETPNIFADTTTGLLQDNIANLRDYYVQLILTKGSDIIISDPAKITIKNLSLAATGISKYTLTNDNRTSGTNDDFDMNSTKLVVAEDATFKDITVTAADAKEDIAYGSGAFSLKTSDAGVISVSNNVITAEAPGTATITITYGKATKAVSFTVVNETRSAKSLEVKKVKDGSKVTQLKIAINEEIKVTVLDQFGDPVKGKDVTAEVSNTKIFTIAELANLSNTTPGIDSKESIDVDLNGTASPKVPAGLRIIVPSPVVANSASITFTVDSFKVGTLNVAVTNDKLATKRSLELYKVDNNDKRNDMRVALTGLSTDNTKLEKEDFSTDQTLDISDDKYVIYQVNTFNAAGVELGPDALTVVSISESKAGVLARATNPASPSTGETGLYDVGKRLVVVAGSEAGTATIIVQDSAAKSHTIKVTVVDNGSAIKSISLKTPAAPVTGRNYSWKSVLDYTESGTGKDPVVKGVTLSKGTAYEVRFNTSTYEFYIDKDADGIQDGDEKVVGLLVVSVSGSTIGNTPVAGQSYEVKAGDDCTINFKVFDKVTDGNVVANKSIRVDI